MSHERELKGVSGWAVVCLHGRRPGRRERRHRPERPRGDGMGNPGVVAVVLAVDCLCVAGLTVVNPNQAKVVTLFGVYKGSIKAPASGGSIRSRRAAGCRCACATSRAAS